MNDAFVCVEPVHSVGVVKIWMDESDDIKYGLNHMNNFAIDVTDMKTST